MKKNGKSKKNPVVTGPVPVPADVESIPLTADESNKLRDFDQQMASGKLQLADLELQLADLQAKKGDLVSNLKTLQAQFIADVNKDNRRWNLDTKAAVFQLVKP